LKEPLRHRQSYSHNDSGKSSLIAALLRLLDLESGTIFIDGLDLQVIPRGLIRERLITIPQDPFMLNGSVRLNVDPSGTVVDDLIIEALTKVHLWPIIETRGGLDADLNTQPLSQGQQQLFCLGRAMLRQGKVLILDEATSSVDTETDKLMQEIIREEFKDRTIITVAHRLNTILDADRILVMDSGQVVEYDAPQALLSRDSAFRALHGR
jgi:ATP-binding cassette subfamily C (CFTR/MRP) protein 1